MALTQGMYIIEHYRIVSNISWEMIQPWRASMAVIAHFASVNSTKHSTIALSPRCQVRFWLSRERKTNKNNEIKIYANSKFTTLVFRG